MCLQRLRPILATFLCVFVYLCICTQQGVRRMRYMCFVWTSPHVYTYIFLYIQTHTYMFIHVQILFVDVRFYVYICLSKHRYVRTCTYMCMCMFACMFACKCEDKPSHFMCVLRLILRSPLVLLSAFSSYLCIRATLNEVKSSTGSYIPGYWQVSSMNMARQSSPNKAIVISDGRFSWAKPVEVKKENKPAAPKASGLQKLVEAFSSKPKAAAPPPSEYNVILRDVFLEVSISGQTSRFDSQTLHFLKICQLAFVFPDVCKPRSRYVALA
jgi:hypothetical protein